MATVSCRRLGQWLVALALGSSAGPRFAVAGNDIHLRIVAATPDGKDLAVAVNGAGVGPWVCGLTKDPPTVPLMPEALAVTAECGGMGQLLSFERWTWNRSTPEVRGLRPILRADTTNTPARIATDPDTQVRRIEVLHEGKWYPVLADEASTVDEATAETRYGSPGRTTPGSFSEIRGFVRAKDGIVVTFSNTDAYGLIVVDDAIALSHREIVDVNARLAPLRDKARERTKALREQYAGRSGAFKERGESQGARKRSRAGAAREALKLWERARAFGSLSSAELRDALWLLAWLDAPTRRQEGMRLYLEFLERDPAAADAVVRELAADPETLAFAVHLQTRYDPLRGLPSVTGCSSQRIAEHALGNLSNEDLLWLHRAQWAAQGCYRFSDPRVQRYFDGFTWYAAISKDAWRSRVKKLRQSPDAPLLNKPRNSIPADACKENLELILNAERARGLSPPSL